MQRCWSLLLLALPVATGCAMCCGVDDYNYAAYGGRRPRGDMSQGRVGSAFAPADALVEYMDMPADAVLADPPAAEELELPSANEL